MKKEKEKQLNPALWAILSFLVPLVIYIWFYKIDRMLKVRDKDAPSYVLTLILPALGFFLLLTMFTLNFALIENIVVPLVIAVLIGLAATVIYYFSLSQSISNISRGNISAGLLIICFIFVYPVAIYLCQDILNKSPAKQVPKKYRKSMFDSSGLM